jgi:hypothetical protein
MAVLLYSNPKTKPVSDHPVLSIRIVAAKRYAPRRKKGWP